MTLKVCYDRLSEPNIGYPNLGRIEAKPFHTSWRNFDHEWPWCVPLRLLLYLRDARIDYKIVTVDAVDDFAWYPVALSWFDFDIDYFALLSKQVRIKLKARRVKLLFYYHEGDNPERIKTQLDSLALNHALDQDCYVFVSANTAARGLENFVYFGDHELFFRYVNRYQTPDSVTDQPRPYTFTILNRRPKWWRASVMSDLQHRGILHHSLWSYNTAREPLDESELDNPLKLNSVPGWRQRTQEFVRQEPRFCDDLNHQQHNDHHGVNQDLYKQSWCHVILETHFDADQSQGVFLTEKTWKVIKYGQPFVLVGPAGSLQELRDMGYRVFDDVIDNSYDLIVNNTQRWQAIARTLESIVMQMDHVTWFNRCRKDIDHNRQLFLSRQKSSLNSLVSELTCLSQ